MRERSQQKGKDYVDNVIRWLINRPLLGLMPELFGYSYDVSQLATRIGGEYFDFSLKLCEGKICKKILYVECKFRDERRGNLNEEFKRFIKKVYTTLKKCKETENYNNSEFIFIATIPPDDWRKFLNKKSEYFYDIFGSSKENSDTAIIAHLANILHVLVLSNRLIGG